MDYGRISTANWHGRLLLSAHPLSIAIGNDQLEKGVRIAAGDAATLQIRHLRILDTFGSNLGHTSFGRIRILSRRLGLLPLLRRYGNCTYGILSG